MHSFKKAAGSIALFLAFTILLSCVIAAPAFMPDSLYNDSHTRYELAGTLDTIICGQSQAIVAFVPEIIDERLGTNSYNLSSYIASADGRKTMLEKELARNPVQTVVLEIAFDCLLASSENDATGEAMIVCKLDTAKEKIGYLLSHTSLKDGSFDGVYAMFMRYGLNAWKAKLSGNVNIPQSNRGRVIQVSNDLTLSDDRIAGLYNSQTIDTNFSAKITAQMADIVEMCRENGAEVIIAVTPLSDETLWRFENLECVHEYLAEFARKQNCAYVDFNLYKERGRLFDDSKSFYDGSHMSDTGAKAYSAAFADVLKMLRDGESIDALFYSDYDEGKEALPYAEALKTEPGASE